MTQRERAREILSLLRGSEGELGVDDVCRRLNVSPATVRRDFARLAERGDVAKTWGGIRAVEAGGEGMPPFEERQGVRIPEKRRIAARAAALVEPGQTVMIDGGTTTQFLALHLAPLAVRIVTNSLVIAQSVDRHRGAGAGAEVFLTGGFLYPRSEMLVGPGARAALREYWADWAFLSASGLDESQAMNNNQWVVECERQMMDRADRVALLADHGKFGVRAMARLCGASEIQCLVTDQEGALPEAWRAVGVHVIVG